MLTLTRNLGESLIVGDELVITIVDIAGDKVRLTIESPCEIREDRDAKLRAAVAKAEGRP